MVYNLFTWPPGTVDRFHVLSRAAFCGAAVAPCVHDDPACCCGQLPCCCDNLWPPTDDDWLLAFRIIGDISCYGYLQVIQGTCNYEGSRGPNFECIGSGDCSILEILDMLLYCPAGETTPDEYRLNIVVDTLCGSTYDSPVKAGATCGPPPYLEFDFTTYCEGDISCSFTVIFETNPYLSSSTGAPLFSRSRTSPQSKSKPTNNFGRSLGVIHRI